MRSLAFKVVGGVVVGAIVLGFWAFFAPTKVGGSTTYSVTSGISMEPMLHKNDLAFVRTQSTYHVGDVVLYQSPVVHQPVLHRIILIQHGNYFFQGDNNGFVDPGLRDEEPAASARSGSTFPRSAPRSAGSVHRRTPRCSQDSRSWSSRCPAPRPSVDGVGVEDDGDGSKTDILGGHASPARVRRDAATRRLRRGASRRRPQPFLEGPTSTLMALGVTLILSVLLLGIGFSRPLHVTGALPNVYQQTGTFSYSAAPNTTTEVYPTGVVRTGDPIYPSLVDVVNLRFGYRFTSALPHDVKGTIELRGVVLSQTDTWQEVSTVGPIDRLHRRQDVRHDRSVLGEPLHPDHERVGGLRSRRHELLGRHPAGRPHHRHGRRSPDRPEVLARAPLRGDHHRDPGRRRRRPHRRVRRTCRRPRPPRLTAVLHPAQPGSIPHQVTNVISVAKYKVPVSLLRTLGIVLAVLALALALVHDRRRRRAVRRSTEEQIAKQFHTLIVPVAALGPSQMPIEVTDFTHLAGLASLPRTTDPLPGGQRQADVRGRRRDPALRHVRHRPPRRT